MSVLCNFDRSKELSVTIHENKDKDAKIVTPRGIFKG